MHGYCTSSGKANMHNYKFDSKGATNKNLKKRKVIGFLVVPYFSPAAILNV